MIKNAIHLFIFAFIINPVFAQEIAKTQEGRNVVLWIDGTWTYTDSSALTRILPQNIPNLQLSAVTNQEVIVHHTGFSLLYNEPHEQASWVAYELSSDKAAKGAERAGQFKLDPKVATGTANDRDYAGSGYDRGHLAPAADMTWSDTAMAESFYYNNMSPQLPGFNRGVWKRLEQLVRNWAGLYDTIYIATGPVLQDNLPSIGPNQVSVPAYFYKVILDYKAPSVKGIGFILAHGSSTDPLEKFAVTIDSVQQLTGIDFFSALPDDQERIIESSLCLPCWSWRKPPVTTAFVQCKGLTQSGLRCTRKTTNPNGYCHQHDPGR